MFKEGMKKTIYTLTALSVLFVFSSAFYLLGYEKGFIFGEVSHHVSSNFGYTVVANGIEENQPALCDGMAKFGLLNGVIRLDNLKDTWILTEEEKERIAELQREVFQRTKHLDLFTITGYSEENFDEYSPVHTLHQSIKRIETNPCFIKALRELELEQVVVDNS